VSGAFFLAVGLVSSAIGAAVAGVPWVAVAAAAAAVPYVAIAVVRVLEGARARQNPLASANTLMETGRRSRKAAAL